MSNNRLMCPGPCGQKRRVNQLLCHDCWHRLPLSVRSDLYRSWQAAYKNLTSDLLWSRYMQAKRVAIASLR